MKKMKIFYLIILVKIIIIGILLIFGIYILNIALNTKKVNKDFFKYDKQFEEQYEKKEKKEDMSKKILILVVSPSILIIWIAININSVIKQKKNINELTKNGKLADAKVIDYLIFKTAEHYSDSEMGGWKQYFDIFPVLEIYDENQITKKHIYVRTFGKNTKCAIEKYQIGTKVKVYYKETKEIEQLNFDKKIFLNKKYENLKTIKKDTGKIKLGKTFYINGEFQNETLTSHIHEDNIENFPTTKIEENNIFIQEDDEFEQEINYLFTTIIVLLVFILLLWGLYIISLS